MTAPCRWLLFRLATLGIAATLGAGPSLAGKAHEHGVARVDVAVEPGRLTVLLEMPLDGLAGFERAPRDDAERKAVDAALAKLRNAALMFAVDPAAGCTPGPVVLTSAALGLGPAGLGKAAPVAGAKEAHDDIDGSYEFNCADGFRAGFVEIGLFDAFARLQRIEVQAVTRKGQIKATLKRPSSRLTLAR